MGHGIENQEPRSKLTLHSLVSRAGGAGWGCCLLLTPEKHDSVDSCISSCFVLKDTGNPWNRSHGKARTRCPQPCLQPPPALQRGDCSFSHVTGSSSAGNLTLPNWFCSTRAHVTLR